MRDERTVLTEIREQLEDKFNVLDLVLFGSRAKGNSREDSDYDVLVITDSEVPFVKRQGLALLALGKREYPLDLLVYTRAEIEQALTVPGSIVFWALKEGRRIDAL